MGAHLSRGEARNLLEQGGLVVDVRSAEEYSSGHGPDTLNLPLHLLPVLAEERIPWDRPLLLCCASGARSAAALAFLLPQGYDAHNLGSWVSHPHLS